MSQTLSLPVLPLDDTVVLPTMVVPVEISGAEVRAAIEAARMSASAPTDPNSSAAKDSKPEVLLVPGSAASTLRSARSASSSRPAGCPAASSPR